jgi:hypothetical protein
MQVVLTIDDESAEVIALQTRFHLEGIVRANQWLMLKNPRIPPLYQSGVKFRLEPWAMQVQHFSNCMQVLKRGWGDCKTLSAWRLASLRNAASTPEIAGRYGLKIYWRVHDDDDPLHDAAGSTAARRQLRIFHVQVRHPNGAIEDPSRMLHS